MKDWNNISFWRNELPFAVERIQVNAIHVGNSGSKVYRVFLSGKGSMPRSVIVKQTGLPKLRSILSIDNNCWQREALFYQLTSKSNQLNTARLYYCDINVQEKETLLVLEDLANNFYIPDDNYKWSAKEKDSIMMAYVSLDSFSRRLKQSRIDLSFLAAPEFCYVTPIDLIEAIRTLDNWLPVKGLISPLKSSLDSIMNKLNYLHHEYKLISTTLSYNDFYPANIALPYGEGSAILFDFQLIGWGNALNNMKNAFGNPSFGESKEEVKLAYLKAIKFKNNTSFSIEQLFVINDILSSLYMIWVMGHYARNFPENNSIPNWFEGVVHNLPNQFSLIKEFM